MSLTSHLEDPRSPIGQYFSKRFPHVASIIVQAQKELATRRTLRPANGSPDYPYGLVGMAIDYRVRYYFTITPSSRLVAKLGAYLICGRMRTVYEDGSEDPTPYDPVVIDSFFAKLDATVDRIQPAGRTLMEAEERELARYCFVLGCLEVPARADRWKYGPLVIPNVKQSAEELLAIPTEDVIDDICSLSTLFYTRCPSLLTRPFILNPTFAGSGDVGGADADLIVPPCLIDLKTTTYPAIKAQWLYQILGYVLLDYADAFQVEWVALYMARQGKLLSWKLADLLPALTGAPDVSISTLRKELQAIIAQERLKEAS